MDRRVKPGDDNEGLSSSREEARAATKRAPSQIALAWVLKRSPAMLPIPGTSKVKHLEENVAAVNVHLSEEEFAALDREGRAHQAA